MPGFGRTLVATADDGARSREQTMTSRTAITSMPTTLSTTTMVVVVKNDLLDVDGDDVGDAFGFTTITSPRLLEEDTIAGDDLTSACGAGDDLTSACRAGDDLTSAGDDLTSACGAGVGIVLDGDSPPVVLRRTADVLGRPRRVVERDAVAVLTRGRELVDFFFLVCVVLRDTAG